MAKTKGKGKSGGKGGCKAAPKKGKCKK